MSKQLNELLDDLKKWIDSPLDEIDMNYGIWEIDVNQSKELLDYIKTLQQENKQLKDQLEYLRNGAYLNQIKWERDFLDSIVQDEELSKEEYNMKELAKANTKLAEQMEVAESNFFMMHDYFCQLRELLGVYSYESMIEKIKQLKKGKEDNNE